MKDALPLLTTLQGHGVTAREANRSGWTGGFGNITYDSGPAPGALVNMDHLMHESIEPVWDVIGVINGTKSDEVVVVGNHRDAWVIGGAADPNSGSAVLIELANALGKLLEKGWKPRRTMYVTNADAQRYLHPLNADTLIAFLVRGMLKNSVFKARRNGSSHIFPGSKPRQLLISILTSQSRAPELPSLAPVRSRRLLLNR